MVQIDDKLISADVFEKHFACDIAQCAGACCVLGDSGAPLEKSEKKLLEDEYEHYVTYMKSEGRKAVEEQGHTIIDSDGDLVTPLINDKECAYSCFNTEGVCYCAIERAFLDGKTKFRKPISCYLYPIRLKQLHEYIALNYDVWHACEAARENGLQEGVPVFRFLKEPLIARFGKAFYEEMETLYQDIIVKRKT
ncbi:MAG: DUF3109 family protein [Prevotellaceae bacterium]|nr:DUF3109 family protein [Prevotellaceae bacterium]